MSFDLALHNMTKLFTIILHTKTTDSRRLILLAIACRFLLDRDLPFLERFSAERDQLQLSLVEVAFHPLRRKAFGQQETPFEVALRPASVALYFLLPLNRDLVADRFDLDLLRTEVLDVQVHLDLLPVRFNFGVGVHTFDSVVLFDRRSHLTHELHRVSEERVLCEHCERIFQHPGHRVPVRQIS